MPELDPLIRYATDEFLTDGTTTDWEISFVGGYINKTHVFAFSVLRDPETGLESDRTDHSVEIISETPSASTARISPAVPSGRVLYIFRSTPLSNMLVQYGNPNQLTKDNLNLANRQLLNIIQEMADSWGATNLSTQQQLETTINLQAIVSQIYSEVLTLLQAGGIVSVTPTTWTFEGDGEVEQFPLPFADVTAAGMYDTYVELTPGAGDFVGIRPNEDFSIVLGPDGDYEQSKITLIRDEPLAEGQRGFAVLRGYARPWIDGSPLTTVAHTTETITETSVIGREWHNSVLVVDSSEDVTVEVRANTGDSAHDWQRGEFFLVFVKGEGTVYVEGEGAAALRIPDGFLPQARGQYAMFGVTCIGPNEFAVSGDLLRIAAIPLKEQIRLIDRTVLSSANLTAGTVKDSYVLPYDFQLDTIAQNGLYASLTVAQAAGTALTIDVQVNGTSILSTPLTFDNGATSTIGGSVTAAYSEAFIEANRVIPAGARVTFSVTTLGTALAKGAAVYLKGARAN